MKYDATLPWRDIKREGFNDHIGPIRFAEVAEHDFTIDFECDFLAAAKNGQLLHGVCSVARAAREFLFMEGDFYAGERRVLRASGIWVVRSRRQQQ